MAGRAAAILTAAGSGQRLGGGTPKALRDLGGESLLVRAARTLVSAEGLTLVVVAAPPAEVEPVRRSLGVALPSAPITVVAGGASRQASVALALAALDPGVDVVLVHDAARPLAPRQLVESVLAAVQAGAGAVVPVLPVADTVKRVGSDGLVIETVDRSVLRAVQTPQGFRRDVLERAHAAALPGAPATDDAGLVEALGLPVATVPGCDEALKITRPVDLLVAEALLAARGES